MDISNKISKELFNIPVCLHTRTSCANVSTFLQLFSRKGNFLPKKEIDAWGENFHTLCPLKWLSTLFTYLFGCYRIYETPQLPRIGSWEMGTHLTYVVNVDRYGFLIHNFPTHADHSPQLFFSIGPPNVEKNTKSQQNIWRGLGVTRRVRGIIATNSKSFESKGFSI